MDIKYLLGNISYFLLSFAALLMIIESRVPAQSIYRQKAKYLHKFFNQARISELASTIRKRYVSKYSQLLDARLGKNVLESFLFVQLLVVAPLHSYVHLPHPFPTKNFALYPSLHIWSAIVLSMIILRLFARNLDDKSGIFSQIALHIASLAFAFICSAVMIMDLTFLFSAKDSLLSAPLSNPTSLFYLDLVFSKKHGIAILMAFISFSFYYTSIAFYSICLYEIRLLKTEIVRVFILRISQMARNMGFISIAMYYISPELGFTQGISVLVYFSAAVIMLCTSAYIHLCTKLIKDHVIWSFLLILVLPTALIYFSEKFIVDIQFEKVLMIGIPIISPLFFPYLFSMIIITASISISAGKFFGTPKISQEPFSQLGLFLTFLGAILQWLLFQID